MVDKQKSFGYFEITFALFVNHFSGGVSMEEKDTANQELVQQLFDGNPRFRRLYEEHHLLEKKLQKLDQRPYLTPDEEIERKKVQKLKLAGKDEMSHMLSQLG
jgi:uncharacterized protein